MQFNEIILLSFWTSTGRVFYFVFFLFAVPTFVRVLALYKSLFFWAKLLDVRQKLVQCWRLIHKKCKMYAIFFFWAKLTHNVFLSGFLSLDSSSSELCIVCGWWWQMKKEDAKKQTKPSMERRGKKITFRVHDFSFGDIQAIVQIIVKLDYMYQHSKRCMNWNELYVHMRRIVDSVFMCNAINSWVQL